MSVCKYGDDTCVCDPPCDEEPLDVSDSDEEATEPFDLANDDEDFD